MHSTHQGTSGNVPCSSVLALLEPWIEDPWGKAVAPSKTKPFNRDEGKTSSPVREQWGRRVRQASESEIWLTVGRQAQCRGTAASLTWWIRKATKELRESRQFKQSKTWKGNRSDRLCNLSIKQASTSKEVWCPKQETSQHVIVTVMEEQAYRKELIIIIITSSANNLVEDVL